MSLATLFTLANAAVMPGWLALVLLPRWRFGTHVLAAWLLPGLMSALYLGLLITSPGGEGGFGSLEGVMALFSSEHAVLAGWVHYLCFDLVVGAWEVRDARRRQIPHGFVVPCLGLTLMLGPLGFGAYGLLRVFWGRRGPRVPVPGA